MSVPRSTAQPSPGTRQLPGIAPGISDFAKIRREGKYYVDKTAQLAALLEDDQGPLLLTRPRRFGKTLTLDTLRRFLELDYEHPGDTARQLGPFAGLAILEDPKLQACRKRCMGQFPVISVSLGAVQGDTWEGALQRMCTAVAGELGRHADLIHSLLPGSRHERSRLDRYTEILSGEDGERQARILPDILADLALWLHRIYSRSVYILIDEYDTPLARAWGAEQASPGDHDLQGYYRRMAELMRGILLPLLKPPPAAQDSIERCILTGCTRVSRESLFSGANNLIVQGMDHLPTADLMGFTGQEVREMLRCFSLEERLQEVDEWYDGYRFAGVRIYNPWSIASFCQAALDTPGHQAAGYWAHAGINDELTACLHALPEAGLEKLRLLCEGQRIALPIREFFSYDDLLRRPDEISLFTLLCHTGYITRDDDGRQDGSSPPQWRIPNREVHECFEQQILGMYDFVQTARTPSSRALLPSLLQGDVPAAERHLNWLLQRFLSFHVLGPRSRSLTEIRALIAPLGNPRLEQLLERVSSDLPERVYHLLIFGLLCGMEDRRLISLDMDRELGGGRPDISFVWACRPGDEPQSGCIMEFKAAAGISDHQLLTAADEGLRQIRDRDYARGLHAHYPGLTRVWAYGVGCAGKRCAVAGEQLPAPGDL